MAELYELTATEAAVLMDNGEISSEGCLMLADALRLDAATVVYDLGSGFGRATVLFALYARHSTRQLMWCNTCPLEAACAFSV